MIDRYSRQSFLGRDAQSILSSSVVGVVGLGGGGSHIVQQLAHVGVRNYVLYDHDYIELSNLNRLVGGTLRDVKMNRRKIDIATRTIKRLHPSANIHAEFARWQDQPLALRNCDIIFGCVDGLRERQELERCSRRYLIPYIDIGLDVHCVGDEPPRMSGQVILSSPGSLCMSCMNFLSESELAEEGARYGDAGINPQVVWANGALASCAVGLAIDILTDWTRALRGPVYFEYNGNEQVLFPHIRSRYFSDTPCPHYPSDQVGDPLFVVRK